MEILKIRINFLQMAIGSIFMIKIPNKDQNIKKVCLIRLKKELKLKFGTLNWNYPQYDNKEIYLSFNYFLFLFS
jgi:hypothetical protein